MSVGDVGGKGTGPAALALDQANRFRELLLRARQDGDCCSGSSESLGDGAANTAAAASDERDLPF
jgi:hypothetical protein